MELPAQWQLTQKRKAIEKQTYGSTPESNGNLHLVSALKKTVLACNAENVNGCSTAKTKFGKRPIEVPPT